MVMFKFVILLFLAVAHSFPVHHMFGNSKMTDGNSQFQTTGTTNYPSHANVFQDPSYQPATHTAIPVGICIPLATVLLNISPLCFLCGAVFPNNSDGSLNIRPTNVLPSNTGSMNFFIGGQCKIEITDGNDRQTVTLGTLQAQCVKKKWNTAILNLCNRGGLAVGMLP